MSTEIDNMSFKELCEQIKQEYGTLLPESAYNSPESLIEALKSCLLYTSDAADE